MRVHSDRALPCSGHSALDASGSALVGYARVLFREPMPWARILDAVTEQRRPSRVGSRRSRADGRGEIRDALKLAGVLREADVYNAQAAFAVAAMRSRVTAHVFLRGEAILASNSLFIEMVRSMPGPWRATAGGASWATLSEVVRAQSAALVESAEVARYERSDSTCIVEVRTERVGHASAHLVVATVLDLTSIVRAAADTPLAPRRSWRCSRRRTGARTSSSRCPTS